MYKLKFFTQSIISFILLGLILGSYSYAKSKSFAKDFDEAMYIVPTSAEFVPYSRFSVKIITGYHGPRTTQIAYVFPEILMGEANKVITFERIPKTENAWESPNMFAHCNVLHEIFSCNITLKKDFSSQARPKNLLDFLIPQAYAQSSSVLDPTIALAHLKDMNLDPVRQDGFEQVIRDFYSNEPAGILFYKF